jgi:hypothetical protein
MPGVACPPGWLVGRGFPLHRYDAPLRRPPDPSPDTSLGVRVPLPCLPPCVGGVPAGLVISAQSLHHARAVGHPVPHSGSLTRRHVALPSARAPPVQTCPALRPRWCPAYSPSRTQDCGLPATAHRRLSLATNVRTILWTTTLHSAGLPSTPPTGAFRPASYAHDWVCTWTSLLTCWLGLSQVGCAPRGAHPLGHINQFHRIAPHAKVSGLPRHEQCRVRRALPESVAAQSSALVFTPGLSTGFLTTAVTTGRPAQPPSGSAGPHV